MVKLEVGLKLVIYVVWVVVMVDFLWVCCEFILMIEWFLVIMIMWDVVEVIVELWL